MLSRPVSPCDHSEGRARLLGQTSEIAASQSGRCHSGACFVIHPRSGRSVAGRYHSPAAPPRRSDIKASVRHRVHARQATVTAMLDAKGGTAPHRSLHGVLRIRDPAACRGPGRGRNSEDQAERIADAENFAHAREFLGRDPAVYVRIGKSQAALGAFVPLGAGQLTVIIHVENTDQPMQKAPARVFRQDLVRQPPSDEVCLGNRGAGDACKRVLELVASGAHVSRAM